MRPSSQSCAAAEHRSALHRVLRNASACGPTAPQSHGGQVAPSPLPSPVPPIPSGGGPAQVLHIRLDVPTFGRLDIEPFPVWRGCLRVGRSCRTAKLLAARCHDQDPPCCQELRVLVHPSSTDLPSRTLRYVTGQISLRRRVTGTRWRRLTVGRQALLALAHLRCGDTSPALPGSTHDLTGPPAHTGSSTPWRKRDSSTGPTTRTRAPADPPASRSGTVGSSGGCGSTTHSLLGQSVEQSKPRTLPTAFFAPRSLFAEGALGRQRDFLRSQSHRQ